MIRRLRLYSLAMLLPAMLATPALAQFGFGGSTRDIELVERLDRDGDGYLDRAERDAYRGRSEPVTAQAVNAPVTQRDVDVYADEGLYDPGVLRTIFIEFEFPDWEYELETFYGTDVEVPAKLVVDGREYSGVGIHFRGNTSYRNVPRGRKRGLNLSIDHMEDGQRLLGYRTLNLHNGYGDPTFMRNVLYLQIANAYYPAPKANFVRVVINGEDWGIYANVQQFNSDFTREAHDTNEARWRIPGSFSSRGGLEYLGDDVSVYRRTYDIKSRDTDDNWAALIELTRVLNTTPSGRLVEALEPLLDIDEALRFLAVDNALANTDGYWSRNSDYSLYRDEDGRFHVSAYDANEALQTGRGGRGFGFRGGSAGASLDPLEGSRDGSKALLYRLMMVPELRGRYLAYVRDVTDNWLSWERVGPIVSTYREMIGDVVAGDSRKLYSTSAFDSDLEQGLKPFIESRQAFLQNWFGANATVARQ